MHSFREVKKRTRYLHICIYIYIYISRKDALFNFIWLKPQFEIDFNLKKRTTNHGIDSLGAIESGVPFDDPLYSLIDSLFVASPSIVQPDEARLHVLNSPNHQQILIGLVGILKLLNERIGKTKVCQILAI